MEDIQKLVHKLLEAKEAYYNSDAPLMSDTGRVTNTNKVSLPTRTFREAENRGRC